MLFQIILFFPILFLPEMPSVTCEFEGQVGNQMFEIAAAVAYGLDHGCNPVFPKISKATSGKSNRKYFFHRINTSSTSGSFSWVDCDQNLLVPYYAYSELPYQPGVNVRLRGYYQNERYFAHHAKEIRALFAPSPKILRDIQKKYPHFLDAETVAIHVRTFIPDGRDPNESTNWNYYLRALEEFPDDFTFLIFSDSLSWTKAHFPKTEKQLHFIEGNPYYIDFYLMSLCKHQIVSPESTFSWWAAWLNDHPGKKVVVPHHWHGFAGEDAFPEGWIRVPY